MLVYEQYKESESQFGPVNSPKNTFKQDKSTSEIATIVASTAISSDLIARSLSSRRFLSGSSNPWLLATEWRIRHWSAFYMEL